MSQYGLMLDPKIKVGHWPIFHGSVILPYILRTILCINMIPWANESIPLDLWSQNKSGSLWPIFHGSVFFLTSRRLFDVLIWYPGLMSQLDAWPQSKSGSWWPLFYGSVILPYILKTFRCINIIPLDNESLWFDADLKTSESLWPIFHGSVYIISILLLTYDKGHRLRMFYTYSIQIKVWCWKFAFRRRCTSGWYTWALLTCSSLIWMGGADNNKKMGDDYSWTLFAVESVHFFNTEVL